MLIALRPHFSWERVLRCAKWTLWCACALTFLGYLIAIVRVRGEATSTTVASKNLTREVIAGPLALKKSEVDPFALALERKINVLAASSRPGLQETTFCLGLGKKQVVVREGTRLYLTLVPHQSGGIESLGLANEPTGVTGVIHVVDGKTLEVKVFGDEIENTQVILSAQASGVVASTQEQWNALASARWLGKDRFFARYGGPEYRPLGQKEVLEVGDGKGRYFLYVGRGDRIILEEEKWRVATPSERVDSSVLLAQVSRLQGKDMAIEGWDDGGFLSFTNEKAREKSPPRLKVDQGKLITDGRVRSAKEISCVLGKKRMVLKEGDWLLKSKSGWHKLKSQREVIGYVDGKISGELLIIDQIDSKGNLSGHYYDALRLQELPINLSIAKGGK